MHSMENLMDTLTPKPPFDPSKKNQAVDFGTPRYVKTASVFPGKVITGINRTKGLYGKNI